MGYITPQRYVAYKAETREREREYQSSYYAKNRERIRARQNASKAWKGRRLDSTAYRQMLVSVLRQRDGDLCALCGRLMEEGEFSIDHIIPRHRGGTHDAENLRLAHKQCNLTAPRGHKKWRGKELSSG